MKYDFLPLSDAVSKKDVDEYKTLYKLPSSLFSVITAILLFAVFLAVFSFVYKGSTESILFIALIAALAAYFVSKSITKVKKLKNYRVRLWKFAKKNNINYQSENHNVTYEGNIFNRGENRYSYDILDLVNSENRSIEVANYQYDIRTESRDSDGKTSTSTTTYRQGYILINLDHKLPHIILDSKKNGSGSIGNGLLSISQSQRLELEGDFNDYFDLYVPNGYERDALYIFTPDVMAVFVDETCNFDAEIIDDKLFIYSRVPLNLIDQSILEKLFKLIDLVSKKTINQADNYVDERVGNRQANVIAAEGRRLKFGLPKPIIVIIIIVAALNILSFILALLPKR